MEGIIIYKGKYGATSQYAKWLGEALELPVVQAGTETMEQLADVESVILGTSIYIGTLQLKNWIKENQAFLATKKLYLFLVTGTSLDETEKLEGYLKNNIPEELRRKCKCFFFPGKLEFNGLSWSDKLLLKIGAWLSKGSKNEISLVDYNKVNRQYIADLVKAVNHQNVV